MYEGHNVRGNALRAFLILAMLVINVLSLKSEARAEMGASVSAPIRHGIDATCSAFERTADKGSLEFVKLDFAGRPKAGWRRVVPKQVERAQNDPKFLSGIVATAFVQSGHVALAGLSYISSTGDGGTHSTYCFIRGRLARMKTTIKSVTFDMEVVRTKYYADGQLLARLEHKRPYSKGGTGATVPDSEPVYMRPEALPFYPILRASR